MFPTSVVRRGLESVSKATRPARNLGTSRTAKRVASRPSQNASLTRKFTQSVSVRQKRVDEVDIDALEADLDKLQQEMRESTENAKKQTESDPMSSNKTEDEQLADLFKRQQQQMTGDDDIIGGAAEGTNDVLIEESEKVAGPSSSMEFQAETRKLLDIVARSLYSDKEVFVRELISNSSDALEKTRFKRQGGEGSVTGEGELRIMISADEVKKTLTIQDSGVGMTREELISDLGRIGHSGTGEYLKAMEEASTTNLIGQFGVGFYATFMVAQRIRVYSRSLKKPDQPGHVWESDGAGSYTVAEAEGVSYGTKIVIDLLPTCEEFSKKQTIESIIRKYSNFVGFPIYLNGNKVNTVKALWLLPPGEVSTADHKEFYQFISHAHDSPLYHLHYSADSPINIRSIFYIPETHMEKYGLGVLEPGVSLYTRKVLIQAKCKGLLPDWLRFIKGVVDSEDIPLNLSRELLQDSGLIKRLSNVLTRRILKYLEEQAVHDEVKYLKFYNEYSQFLKQGICTDLKWKEDLARLLRMESSKTTEGVNTTLEQYITNMHPSQTEIYYLCIPSRSYAEASPYYETFQKRGVEVLFLYHSIDDFVMSNLAEYKGKKLVSIESANASENIKAINPEAVEDPANPTENLGDLKGEKFTSFASWMKDVLATRVTTVVETTRLSSSPAVVIDHESASFRRMMKMVDPTRAPTQPKVQLQINATHPVILRLNQVREADAQLARDVAEQIMDNAMIQAGLLDDNRSMVPRLTKILDRALQNKL